MHAPGGRDGRHLPRPGVPLASTGIERRRAVIRARIYFVVVMAALLALVLTGHGSWLGSGGS
jgi:hypothetical protein